jgi:hypothetical protein
MKNITFFFVLIFLSVTAAYSDETSSGNTGQGLYLQLGAGTDPDSIGGEIGIFDHSDENISYLGGFGFLASEQFDDVFVGFNLGVRIGFDSAVTPFVGAGVFAGYSKKNVKADNDGEDNDGDGAVDEPGEEDEVIDNVIASAYPEMGFIVKTSNTSHVILSGRYVMTTEGRSENFWLYSVGFGFLFE